MLTRPEVAMCTNDGAMPTWLHTHPRRPCGAWREGLGPAGMTALSVMTDRTQLQANMYSSWWVLVLHLATP